MVFMDESFVCDKCGNVYKTRTGLTKHIKQKHNPWKRVWKVIRILVIIVLSGTSFFAVFFPGQFVKFRDQRIPFIGEGSPEVSITINLVARAGNPDQLLLTEDNYRGFVQKLRYYNFLPASEDTASFTINSFANLEGTNKCFTIFTLIDYPEKASFCTRVPTVPDPCDDCIEASVCLRNSGERNAGAVKSRICLNDDYYIEGETSGCITIVEPLLLTKNETMSKPFIIRNKSGKFEGFDTATLIKSSDNYHLTWGLENNITDFFQTGTLLIDNCQVQR